MIIETFLVLTGIAILCIVYGEVTKELSWSIVGFSIFFILAGWVLFGKYTDKDVNGLEFRSGTLINASDSSNIQVNYVYSSYDDTTTFWIGLFLTIMGALGWILVVIPRKYDNVQRR